mmetsp:Transcript_39149/g.47083  ORF Transcript_39149/g.47083 Transcript_39149/m.47083 type:complete len:247 (+) Transcript_39149:64-804(+)
MNEARRHPVFGYGSNNIIQLCERVGCKAIPSMQAVLPHYERIFAGFSKKWGGAVASVQPQPNKICRGTLAWLTMAEIRKLDRHEGCSSRMHDCDDEEKNRYRRVKVPLVVWGCTGNSANCVAENGVISPKEADLNTAMILCGEEHKGFSTEFLLLGTIYDLKNGASQETEPLVLSSWVYIQNGAGGPNHAIGKPSGAYVSAIVKNLELHWKKDTVDELQGLQDTADAWSEECVRSQALELNALGEI